MIHATLEAAKEEAAKSETRRFVYQADTADGKTMYIDGVSKKDATEQYTQATLVNVAIPGKPAKEKKAPVKKVEFDFAEIAE